MKKYDSKTRKWISIEEYEKKYSPRSKANCRGGKPHDWVLVLPFHTTYTENYRFNPEEYYRLMDELYDYEEELSGKLTAMGVKSRYGRYHHRETRCFMCSLCKKQKYDL